MWPILTSSRLSLSHTEYDLPMNCTYVPREISLWYLDNSNAPVNQPICIQKPILCSLGTTDIRIDSHRIRRINGANHKLRWFRMSFDLNPIELYLGFNQMLVIRNASTSCWQSLVGPPHNLPARCSDCSGNWEHTVLEGRANWQYLHLLWYYRFLFWLWRRIVRACLLWRIMKWVHSTTNDNILCRGIILQYPRYTYMSWSVARVHILFFHLVNIKLHSTSVVHAFPFRMASTPVVRFDLSGGLPTCL